MRPALVLTALLLTAACSTGTPAAQVTPRDVGHGGTEDVLRVLAEQRAPCVEATVLGFDPEVEEQHTTCVFEGQRVNVHHFVDMAQADRFRMEVERRGGHGLFSPAYAIVTPDEETVERLSRLLVFESRR